MVNDTQFLIIIFSVIVFFMFFIFLLLRYRKKMMKENLLLNSNDAWESIKKKATSIPLERTNLLYGIYQDQTSTEVKTVLRNNLDEEIGETIKPLGKRQKSMIIHAQKYIISFPLTWKKQIILEKENHPEILARYKQTGWFGKHEIEIPGLGTIISSRLSFDGKAACTYKLNGRIIGMMEMTFNGYPKGRIAILPDSIPLEVRLFILSH